MPKHIESAPPAAEPESLAELRGDCARMAPHWSPIGRTAPVHPPVSPSSIRGVRVPSGSAELLDGMSEYGD
ncbi:hypothetical protein [Streptomyces sp. H27-D2]|uniref:hypothetical protein n=1 Tax=Streptomyces sp. H27-D2 TaxID=3046304 RepID=UPI002DB8E5FC|nr:hypothetical protein [Streptomyces sp. H27-D2]MEC4019334.1 hypothetical protein [Streptomyces sp. H27-D2]